MDKDELIKEIREVNEKIVISRDNMDTMLPLLERREELLIKFNSLKKFTCHDCGCGCG